jgi:signal recognition particle receptor subunit alpha
MEAIREAKDTGRADVVLIDTAGRMHNNEKYMLSLGNLVQLNRPDLVLFVGEALVGNDAVDQLLGFNRALEDAAIAGKEPRLVDGIILTKFDTIDDKVCALRSCVCVCFGEQTL